MVKVSGSIIAIILILGVGGYLLFSQKPNSARLPAVQNSQTQNSPTPETSSQPASSSQPPTSLEAIPGTSLKLNSNFRLSNFAKDLGNPRDLEFSPGGTLLASNPNSGEVFALPDKNNDGLADSSKIIIKDENRPHGLSFYGGKLFIADVDKVVRYNWDESSLTATKDKVLFSLPQNNDHNSRTIIFDKSGKMYVSVGSTCNVCIEKSDLSATVLVSDADGNNPTVFAKGLRNAPFIQFNPQSGELWGTEMGRDNLGDDIPPDEINIIKQGSDYGWPICYDDKIHDTNFDKNTYIRDPCADTIAPIYKIPAHSAPLGLAFINSPQFPSSWQNDLLVSLHGSWNRSAPIGYKVVHLKVDGNSITGSEDFLDMTVKGSQATNRPVDLIFDSKGRLFLSDDKSGTIFLITKK